MGRATDPSKARKYKSRHGGEQRGRLERERTRREPRNGSLLEVSSPSTMGEDQRRRRRDWVEAADGLPGVSEDDMSRRNGQRKRGTTRGSPRRTRTAKASRRSRVAVKSRCACEWGGWGREVMRDRDSITRTGARAPGVERPVSLERR